MKRSSFLKAITGGVAAMLGFKPAVKPDNLFNFKVRILPVMNNNPDDFQFKERLEYSTAARDRFRKVMEAFDKRMNMDHFAEFDEESQIEIVKRYLETQEIDYWRPPKVSNELPEGTKVT